MKKTNFRRADLKGKIGFPYGRKHKKGKLSLPRCCSKNCRAAGSRTGAEAMKEAQPYFVANKDCTMVVALSSAIVDGPYLTSILQETNLYLEGFNLLFSIKNKATRIHELSKNLQKGKNCSIKPSISGFLLNRYNLAREPNCAFERIKRSNG
ncbi:uncharacterized protein LOC142521450 [Primulina tabacum]|uniref:uncharacterized protein LOC142521450 n=1 Tax=Primulina tabacum TaxID=48773 RepID=UPI003F5A16BE